MEYPVEFRSKPTGAPKLDEEAVEFARANVARLGVTALAKRYDVGYGTMWKCVKGITYRHLNGLYPPQW